MAMLADVPPPILTLCKEVSARELGKSNGLLNFLTFGRGIVACEVVIGWENRFGCVVQVAKGFNEEFARKWTLRHQVYALRIFLSLHIGRVCN